MWSTVDKEMNNLKSQLNVQNKVNEFKNVVSQFFTNGPGLFVDVHRQCKSIYPISFVGIGISVDKVINDEMRYNFNVNLDPSEFETYSAYDSYIGRELSAYFGKRNMAGFSNLSLEHKISKELRCSAYGHIQHVNNGVGEVVLDYFGDKFTSTLALVNSDLSRTDIIAQHLQEINKKLTIGAELALQTGNKLTIDSSKVALVGRYYDSSFDAIISSTLSLQGVQLCLYKTIRPNLKVGSVLDVCFQSKKIIGSLACELADREFTLKTSVDTTGCLVANLLKNNFFNKEGFIFKPTISLLCNIQKQIKVGIGFDLLI